MPLIRLTEGLDIVARDGGALGAFNMIQLEHAEAYAAAAEAAARPVVIQISENTVRYHGALAPIAEAALAVARESTAPVVVHLDHAQDVELIDAAIALGVPSVMYDGSHLADDDNLASTYEVAGRCRRAGVDIEAELGEVGGKDGVHAPGARTDPGDAAHFVDATGVDALAVAVGSSHAMTSRTAELDDELIAELDAAVPVPLVLHGSSGVSDTGLQSAVRAGMAKINLATHLNVVFTEAVRASLADATLVDPRKYLGPARHAITEEAARLLQLLA